MNDYEPDLIEMEDSEGGTVTLKVERYFYYNGDEYVLLSDDVSPVPEEISYYVMKVVPLEDEGEDMEEFVPVEDELMDALIQAAQTVYNTDGLNDEPK